jgi:hypothetical protein
MIQRNDYLAPLAEENNGLIQQICEQLIELLKGCKGEFPVGLLLHWNNTAILNRVRQMQERIDKAIKERSKSKIYLNWLKQIDRSSLSTWSFEDRAGTQLFFQRQEIDTIDIAAYLEFQGLKLKAIQLFIEIYSKLLAEEGDPNRTLNMLEVIAYLRKEKLRLASALGRTSI